MQTANDLYDGSGNRVAMVTTVSGTATLTAYIGSIEEVQTTGSSTTTTTYYTIGGLRIAAKVNSSFSSFGYDALGSQVVVLNTSGSVIGAHLYGPYGNSRYTTGTLPTSIGFTDQRADSVSGLDYYVARYYDPVVGQFLSADVEQGNPQGMDPYAYVGGNPETLTDPSGQRIVACMPDSEGCDTKGEPTGDSNGTAAPGHSDGCGAVCGTSGSDGTPTPKPKPTSKSEAPGTGCKGTSILGLCVADMGRFLQGSAEVFAALGLLIAALIGTFQASGLVWLIAKALQFVVSGLVGLMKYGISNILGSLAEPPGKGFRIFLDILQLGSDVAAGIVTVVSFINDIASVNKYSGHNLAAKWHGVMQAAATLGAKSMTHATVLLALHSVVDFINGTFDVDFVINDTEQLMRDAAAN